MSVILETYKVKKKLLNLEHPNTYLWIGLFITVLGFIVRWINEYFNIHFAGAIGYALIFTGTLVLLVSQFFNYFSYQDYALSNKGIIKITSDSIIIDSKVIPFEKVIDFSIHLSGFKGEMSYLHHGTEPWLKLGVENEILIKHSNKTVKRNFQLHEERELKLVQDFMSNIIIKNKLSNVPIKRLVQIFSENFREHSDTRDYLAKKIKTGELNATEGLLMMNYSSDNEAKELKKKYSL